MRILLGLAGLTLPALAVLPLSTASAVPVAMAPTAADCSAPTVVGTPDDDELVGTSGPDVIAGYAGDDLLRGFGGDDVLCGGDGADRLVGGRGADTLLGGANKVETEDQYGEEFELVTGDVLSGGPGADHLDVGSNRRTDPFQPGKPDTVTYRGAPRRVQVDLGGTVDSGRAAGDGQDRIRKRPGLLVVGSRHDDVLLGGVGSQLFQAGPGDDVVSTGKGADFVEADGRGQDDDRVSTGAGDDVVTAWRGADQVDTGAGDDVAQVSGEDASVRTGRGADVVAQMLRREASSRVDGGRGSDLFLTFRRTDEGRAFLDLASGVLRVAGGRPGRVAGFESAFVGGGRWELRGTSAGNTLLGLTQVRAFGRGGDDFLAGSGDVDLLDGGPGTDEVHGGGGADTCRSWEEGRCREGEGGSDGTAVIIGRRAPGPAGACFDVRRVGSGYEPVLTCGPWS